LAHGTSLLVPLLVAAMVGTSQEGKTGKNGKTAPAGKLISCRIAYLRFEWQPWRNRLKGNISPCGTGPGTRGWIVNDDGLTALSKHLSGPAFLYFSERKSFLENAQVAFVPGWDDATDPRTPPSGRWVRSPDEMESRILLSGSVTPQGTRLSVDLRDLTPVAGLGDPRVDTINEIPRGNSGISEFRYNGSFDIPMGSILLIRLGTRKGRVESKNVSFERLVLITPERTQQEATPR
jgi:hypothetical protein